MVMHFTRFNTYPSVCEEVRNIMLDNTDDHRAADGHWCIRQGQEQEQVQREAKVLARGGTRRGARGGTKRGGRKGRGDKGETTGGGTKGRVEGEGGGKGRAKGGVQWEREPREMGAIGEREPREMGAMREREAREMGARESRGKQGEQGQGAGRVTRVKTKEEPNKSTGSPRGQEAENADKDVHCFYCGKKGHRNCDCRKRMRKQENGQEAFGETATPPGCEAYAEEEHSWILMRRLDSFA